MTTTNTRPCAACTNTDNTCGCTAAATTMPTTATNPLACTCGVHAAASVTSAALTASVASVADADGPYPAGMSPDIGEALMDGQAGQAYAEVYRATMARHAIDCPTYEIMAAVARGVMPAAERRALRRFEMVGEAITRSHSDILVAAALEPLGRSLVLDEPSMYPTYVEPAVQYDFEALGGRQDMLRTMFRDACFAASQGDLAQFSMLVNSLAPMARMKAVRSGALIAAAAGDDYCDDSQWIATADLLRHGGDLAGSAKIFASVASGLQARSDKAAFDKAQTERDAELSTDELGRRRLQRLADSARARATG